MKFDVWKDIVSQSAYFKSRPDPVTLGGVSRDGIVDTSVTLESRRSGSILADPRNSSLSICSLRGVGWDLKSWKTLRVEGSG